MDHFPGGSFTLLLRQGVMKSVLGREQVSNWFQALAEVTV